MTSLWCSEETLIPFVSQAFFFNFLVASASIKHWASKFHHINTCACYENSQHFEQCMLWLMWAGLLCVRIKLLITWMGWWSQRLRTSLFYHWHQVQSLLKLWFYALKMFYSIWIYSWRQTMRSLSFSNVPIFSHFFLIRHVNQDKGRLAIACLW